MEKTFRNFIDITPWHKEGHSFWGLTRKQAKVLGLGFIVLAILMMMPPIGIPTPDDIINITLSKFMVNYFHIPAITALLLTYTIIPWILFYIGIVIYPYHTQSLLNGYINKLKLFIKRNTKNPVVVVAVVILAYFIIKMYLKII